MSFGPTTKRTRRNTFSVRTLAKWLAKQDPQQTYDYMDCKRCLLAQFAKSRGIERPSAGGDYYRDGRWAGKYVGVGYIELGGDLIVAIDPYTFGAALERANAFLATTKAEARAMSLSRKDFAALARAISRARSEMDPNDPQTLEIAWANLTNEVALVCAASNPNFNRQKFIEACVEGAES